MARFKICIWCGFGNEGGFFVFLGDGTFLKSLQVYFVEIIFTSKALILKLKFSKMIKNLIPQK